ncbi:winged helix-turn-helix domain-containing protein [Streptacidiphilus neutrinimicus]|uniref:helix-turn-helix transcriptional regulator n=1 Tax=Streptacidiphilus neutrinimicus TaxID=105420 RepID=UPI00069373EF
MDQVPGSHATHARWTFLTNHARVLVQISRDPGMRVRDIAAQCLLTERAVQRIIADLEEGGYLTHTRVGRTNHYQITAASPLRHPADAGPNVADLLALLLSHHSGPAPSPNGDGAPPTAPGPPHDVV